MVSLYKNKLSGFTLLEVVVAVAIFALITAITFPALMQFLEARERIEERNQQILAIQKVFLFLQKDLRYTLGRKLKNDYGDESKYDFDAGSAGDHLLRIVTLYPDINIGGLSIPRSVAWKIEDGNLVRIQWPVLEPYVETQAFKQIMLNEVQNVDLKFAKIDNEQLKWLSSWSETEGIPRAVEVILTTKNEQEYRRIFEMSGFEPPEDEEENVL